MDVVLYYLRKKIRYNPDHFNQRSTTMDAICNRYLCKAWKTYLAEPERFDWDKKPFSNLVNCAKGKKMAVGINWVDVDYVYSPFFVEDSQHWLLLEIDLVNCIINVYDSMSNTRHDNKIRENVAAYSMMIPNLLHHINFFEQRPDIKGNIGDFKVVLIKGLEQQSNG